jgi:hypothetical protein
LTGRPTASTFGAVGSNPDFDEHDAQVLTGFNTATAGSAPIPTGLGAAKYNVTAASLTMTIASGSFLYDPSYDGFATYLTPASDTDLGRPIELYGVGFRDSYTRLALGADDAAPPGFEEGTTFSPPGPPASSARRAFPITYLGGNPVDASNNVAEGRENVPFAVGASNVGVGTTVGAGTTFTFNVNVSDPAVQAYLQRGLNDGLLGFVTASLHPASQGGPIEYPNFYTRQSTAVGAIAPTLSLTYAVVPEPGSLALLGMGAFAVFGCVIRRRFLADGGRWSSV